MVHWAVRVAVEPPGYLLEHHCQTLVREVAKPKSDPQVASILGFVLIYKDIHIHISMYVGADRNEYQYHFTCTYTYIDG